MTHWLWGTAALVMLETAVLSLGNLNRRRPPAASRGVGRRVADLTCGARMLGMPATGAGSGTSPWTFVALTLGLVLLPYSGRSPESLSLSARRSRCASP